MTAEEIREMWKELRPQIGKFICQMDNEVKFLEAHQEEFVTAEKHQEDCVYFFDQGFNAGKGVVKELYNFYIRKLSALSESELMNLFGMECPMDVLLKKSIDEIQDTLSRSAVQKAVINRRRVRKPLSTDPAFTAFACDVKKLVDNYTEQQTSAGQKVRSITITSGEGQPFQIDVAKEEGAE